MKRHLSPPDSPSPCERTIQHLTPCKRRRTCKSEGYSPSSSRRQRPCRPWDGPRTPESQPVDEQRQEQHHQEQQQQRQENQQHQAQERYQRRQQPDLVDAQQPNLAAAQQPQTWTARARSILDWANDVASSRTMSERESQGQSQSQTYSNSHGHSHGQRRAHKTSVRARSASPTKKSPEYRQNGMARAHLFVDHVFDPPADINVLRRHILGDGCDNLNESKDMPVELRDRVGVIANDYLQHCRELSRDAKGEAEWKSALLEGIFRPLVRLLGQDTLATSASEKPWRPELKPRPPTLRDFLSIPTPRLSPALHSTAVVPAGINPVDPPPSIQPSDTATVFSETTSMSATETLELDPGNPLTTPKPDIFLGLARQSFVEVHQVLLGEWQDNKQLLSEPLLVQHGLHFPFLLVEAKGLTTSGNMMGAENQAAVGGACAINILEALQRLEPGFSHSRIVFSITTEGPLHQVSIHYHIDGKYHMVVHRAWRATLQRDCTEFVLTLARIIQWGAGEYRDDIVASLSRVIETLQTA